MLINHILVPIYKCIGKCALTTTCVSYYQNAPLVLELSDLFSVTGDPIPKFYQIFIVGVVILVLLELDKLLVVWYFHKPESFLMVLVVKVDLVQ